MSLRTLINLRIVFSVLFILLLGGITAVMQARQSVEKELRSSIDLVLKIIEFGITQIPVDKRHDMKWLTRLDSLQKGKHVRIEVLDKDKSPTDIIWPDLAAERSDRPPVWFIKAIGTQSISRKYTVKMADGQTVSIWVSADPMDEIVEAWGESQAFFWSIVAMLWIIFLAVNLVFQSVFRAVKEILSGLQQVESGHYNQQLPRFGIDEFDRIAREIETLASVLRRAQENNRALARHTMKIQETERRLLSRELHDEMGQSLTAIKAMAVAVKQNRNTDIVPVTDAIIEICDHLAVVVRSMMRTLHPLSLTELGLQAALRDMVNEWQRRKPELAIQLDYDEALATIDPDIGIHIYRIVQECLTNVVRHARASQVSILLEKRGRYIRLAVSDDGIGKRGNRQGFGILGMQERVESLGGWFVIESQPGQGVTIAIRLPYGE